MSRIDEYKALRQLEMKLRTANVKVCTISVHPGSHNADFSGEVLLAATPEERAWLTNAMTSLGFGTCAMCYLRNLIDLDIKRAAAEAAQEAEEVLAIARTA